MDRRNWLYLLLSCVPSLAIMCAAFVARAAITCSFQREDPCYASGPLLITAIVSVSITCLIFIWVLYYGIKHYTNRSQYALLQSNVRYVCTLHGDQWVRSVN